MKLIVCSALCLMLATCAAPQFAGSIEGTSGGVRYGVTYDGKTVTTNIRLPGSYAK